MPLILTALMVAGLTGLPAAGAAAPDLDVGNPRLQAKRDAAAEQRTRKLGPDVLLCKTETRPTGIKTRSCMSRASWEQMSWQAQADLREIVRRGQQTGN
jgi:hypothetical protein